jgi:hypothetical protein
LIRSKSQEPATISPSVSPAQARPSRSTSDSTSARLARKRCASSVKGSGETQTLFCRNQKPWRADTASAARVPHSATLEHQIRPAAIFHPSFYSKNMKDRDLQVREAGPSQLSGRFARPVDLVCVQSSILFPVWRSGGRVHRYRPKPQMIAQDFKRLDGSVGPPTRADGREIILSLASRKTYETLSHMGQSLAKGSFGTSRQRRASTLVRFRFGKRECYFH